MGTVIIDPDLASLSANTLRLLAVDAIQKANSGHPGMPMGAADMAFVLWSRFLRFDPTDPQWAGRDRFLLSAGHGSMLQYALLHLFGFDLPMDQIKNFRQFASKTPGHPEYGLTPGVEVTTGPLGQGFANGVGLALAAKLTATRFGRKDFSPTGTRVFGIVGDGDLMEGISYEAASLAGHLGLGNLVYLYDSNGVTIEGCTEITWSEDVPKRFDAAGWHTQIVDGHDHEAVAKGIENAVACTDRPSLVVCRTHIAYGSPNLQDSCNSHGAPLGVEETLATKRALGWPESPEFFVPDEVRDLFADLAATKTADRAEWDAQLAAWRSEEPDLAVSWDAWWSGELPADLLDRMIDALPEKDDATRNYSGAVLQKAAEVVPGLFGGSADLAPSNKTEIKGQTDVERGRFDGRNLHFGIREHAMGAIANGMALFGGIRPYAATFLVFADYMRPAIRMAALMELPVIYVFSHDSFWVGEDGPTHQPIEHVSSLRLIPNLLVLRPADGFETAAAWNMALRRKDGPTALILTRQKLVRFTRPQPFSDAVAQRGAHVVQDTPGDTCQAILVASGSEVATCVQAHDLLNQQGVSTKVVSMLSQELYDRQPDDYKGSILNPDVPHVFYVEAGYEPGCGKYLRGNGVTIGMKGFGSSAPGKVLAEHFGFTPEKVAQKILDRLQKG